MNKRKKLLGCMTAIAMVLGVFGLPMFSLQANATNEIELLQIAISHLKEDVATLEEELELHLQNDVVTNGEDGVGISKIEKTSTKDNTDTYTITLTDGSSYDFTVTNGVDGTNGLDGKDGADGVDGKDGADGKNGVDGKNGMNGKNGVDGTDGTGIASIEKTSTDDNKDTYTITLDNGATYDFVVTNGVDGKDGVDGEDAVSPTVSDKESGLPLGGIALIIAIISLMANAVLSIRMTRIKKYK